MKPRLQPKTKVWIGTGLAISVVAGAIAFIHHINGPRIVASATTPDGTEFCVVQRCNWNSDPFTTGCYYRKPGGQWGWFYYDHEDWYWRQGRAEVDTETKHVRIYRNGKMTVSFDWESETYKLRREELERDVQGPQSLMPVGWNPSMPPP